MLFLIVRCCECGHFSVKQETKSPKWACKLCGVKQTQTRVYGSSTKAAELRPIMQQFNLQRGAFAEAQTAAVNRLLDQASSTADVPAARPLANEWQQFVTGDDVDDDDDNEDGVDDRVGLRTTALHRVDAASRQPERNKRAAADARMDHDEPAAQPKARPRLVDDAPQPASSAWPVAALQTLVAQPSSSSSKVAPLAPPPPRPQAVIASEPVADANPWDAFVEPTADDGGDDDEDDQ